MVLSIWSAASALSDTCLLVSTLKPLTLFGVIDMENLIKELVYVSFTIILVYTFAYFMGKDANDVVGWVALGIAAGASRG